MSASAGVPERTEIGATERNEHTATLTYMGGPRPGIYTLRRGPAEVDGAGPRAAASQPRVAKKPAKQPAKPKPRRATVQVQ